MSIVFTLSAFSSIGCHLVQNTQQHPFLIHAGSVHTICVLFSFSAFFFFLFLGWWDNWKDHEPTGCFSTLNIRLDSNLSRALSCLRLSCHDFLVQSVRHDRDRRPGKRAQDLWQMWLARGSGWRTSFARLYAITHLVSLRTQHCQHIFPPHEDSPTRLRTFMNQPDMYGVASFVAKCLDILIALFLFC